MRARRCRQSQAAFPGTVREGKVDRALLAQEVAGSPEKLKLLESIVHPMVVKAEIDFLREQERQGAKFAVLEIPLLFETDAHTRVDVTVVVSAPEEVQKARVLARPGMSHAKARSAAQAATVGRGKARARRLRCGHGDNRLQTCRIRSIRFLIRSGPQRPRHGAASSRTFELGDFLVREVVLDTETTGLDPASGHRIVEIGAVELLNCIPTGRVWHCHLNPDRDMPQQAYEVHGLSIEFLSTKPRFHERADDMLGFIEGAMLVMHNAAFDFAFLNAELERLSRPLLRWDRVVDTLALARRRHPGAPCSLDALCKRYGVDLSERGKHSALLDCRLLASVYVELVGGHQARLEFAANGGRGALLTTHHVRGKDAADRPCSAPHRRGAARA